MSNDAYSPELQRAFLLHGQGRYDLAVAEFHKHLAAEPEDGMAHSALAISLLHLGRVAEAQDMAFKGLELCPQNPFPHYVLSRLFTLAERWDDAERAIRYALQVDPTSAEYHGRLAIIQFECGDSPSALQTAEDGLRHDPEDALCNHVRAVVLEDLGEIGKASEAFTTNLEREPESGLAHRRKGMLLLNSGQWREAQHHLRESLRLTPADPWARAGFVESIQGRNPIYRLYFTYYRWVSAISGSTRRPINFASYFGISLLSESTPLAGSWRTAVVSLQITYFAVLFITYLGHPVFALSCLFHREAWHAMAREQRRQAVWIGGFVGVALTAGVAGLLLSHVYYFRLGLLLGVCAIPLAKVFESTGRRRWGMAALTAALTIGAFVSVFGNLFVWPSQTATVLERDFLFLGYTLPVVVGALILWSWGATGENA
jgi:Flp pilus assembly protein TadD